MWIIIDTRAPSAAKHQLSQYGELLEFESCGLVYPAISGHPDIFMCLLPDHSLIVAPNTPPEFIKKLNDRKIAFQLGQYPVGPTYPQTAHYNALVYSNYLLHNQSLTDPGIVARCQHQQFIHFRQGYASCNILPLGSCLLTADLGITEALKKQQIHTLLIRDEDVKLDGCNHGFWGGGCGRFQNHTFICGNLHHHVSGGIIRDLASQEGVTLIELWEGPVQDVGGIVCIPVSS